MTKSTATAAAAAEQQLERRVAKHFASLSPGEAYATQIYLPGCRGCGAPHPRAMIPPLDADDCPRCGMPSGTPRVQLAPAKITARNAPVRVGLWLLAIGRWLRSKSERNKR